MNIGYPAGDKPDDSQVQTWYLNTVPVGRTERVPCYLVELMFSLLKQNLVDSNLQQTD
jgi:hypothetical protein